MVDALIIQAVKLWKFQCTNILYTEYENIYAYNRTTNIYINEFLNIQIHSLLL